MPTKFCLLTCLPLFLRIIWVHFNSRKKPSAGWFDGGVPGFLVGFIGYFWHKNQNVLRFSAPKYLRYLDSIEYL